jgi:hypothetical protein
VIVSKEVVYNSAVRPDPAHPVEHTESSEEIAWYEVPQKAAEKGEKEEALPRHVTPFGATIGGV